MPETYRYAKIPNWDSLKRRYMDMWSNQVEGNCVVAHIQNPNPSRPQPEPWMLDASEGKYLNPSKLYALQEWRNTAWNWYGDLFEYKVPSYGPIVFIGFCGAPPSFGSATVWHEPLISSLDEADKVHFDEDNRYWKLHLEAVNYFVEACAGVEQIGMTDLGGPTDWISAAMGTENFLLSSINEPDRMRDFALRLAVECNSAFDILHDQLSRANDGIVNWMPVWSPVRMSTCQDDMAANLSPDLYKEVFMPALQKMASYTEHTVLHWHTGCSHHLNNILELSEIDLIQYGYDPNTPSFRGEIGNMQKIQTAGKRLFISCVEACDAEYFICNLDHRGLMMIINTEDDRASEEMQRKVQQWTEERLVKLEGCCPV